MCRLSIFLFITILLISPQQVRAEDKAKIPPLLVITELRILGEKASMAETRAFTEFIRKEIEETGLYRVLSHSSMMAIIKANKFPYPCHELLCFSSLGKLLGADQILAGHFQRRQGKMEITLRLMDVKKVEIINTAYRETPTLSEVELLGKWGRDLIYETFKIDPEEIKKRRKEEQQPRVKTEKEQEIPPEIKYKHPGMIYIPAGETRVGSSNGDPSERPPHTVKVDAFYIGKYEVRNAEYLEFVEATGHRTPFHWKDGKIPNGLDNHPVTWVSYEDAEAYCKWKNARLPTEAEWEMAAHGPTSQVYPWGDRFSPKHANTWEAGRGETAPVGVFEMGKSPFGVMDMAGNVFEWVADFFKPYPGSTEKLNDYDKFLRVLRGGSWNFNAYYARTTHRFARSGGERGRTYGFRIVQPD